MSVKKRVTMALAAGALVAAMVPAAASATNLGECVSNPDGFVGRPYDPAADGWHVGKAGDAEKFVGPFASVEALQHANAINGNKVSAFPNTIVGC